MVFSCNPIIDTHTYVTCTECSMEKRYLRRLKVSCSKEFDIASDELWTLISAPSNLDNCHPFCDTNDVLQWDVDGHSDKLVYLNGRTYLRNFNNWSEGSGYSLLIGKENGAQSYVVWEIESVSPSKSVLSITVYPFILAKLPKPLAYLPHILWVQPRLTTYLESVLSGFQYYSTNNEPVPRNHFGKHPWFS